MGKQEPMNSIELSPSSDEGTPIRAVFCLKKKTDMSKIEEIEDCFILDFDPSESVDFSTLSLSNKIPHLQNDDDELSVLAEKGQVACRDYPHPRHLCVKFPFEKTPHETHCHMCFCFVCETEAPCKEWTKGMKHCNATDSDLGWMNMRKVNKSIQLNT